MVLKIVQVGDPVLRSKARPLTTKEIHSAHIQSLIADMRETMHAAPGVGLAAPQIGQSIQLAVIEDKSEYHEKISAADLKARGREAVPFHVIINPQIELLTPPQTIFYEGCLSLAGFMAAVPRAERSVFIASMSMPIHRPSKRADGTRAFCNTKSIIFTDASTSTVCKVKHFPPWKIIRHRLKADHPHPSVIEHGENGRKDSSRQVLARSCR
ncbi:MAG TPA: peptide deformylase [Alloacidobacterium sp.]|nr:peptide deformylase [Alloacidobacterium sp.]